MWFLLSETGVNTSPLAACVTLILVLLMDFVVAYNGNSFLLSVGVGMEGHKHSFLRSYLFEILLPFNKAVQ